jgi:hypothetical protein
LGDSRGNKHISSLFQYFSLIPLPAQKDIGPPLTDASQVKFRIELAIKLGL